MARGGPWFWTRVVGGMPRMVGRQCSYHLVTHVLARTGIAAGRGDVSMSYEWWDEIIRRRGTSLDQAPGGDVVCALFGNDITYLSVECVREEFKLNLNIKYRLYLDMRQTACVGRGSLTKFVIRKDRINQWIIHNWISKVVISSYRLTYHPLLHFFSTIFD